MKKTRLIAAAAAAVAAAIALSGCAGGGGAVGNADGSSSGSGVTDLKIGNFLDITSWDPANADIGFDGPYLSAVYDPLIALDKDGKPVPALATKWTISDDKKKITLDIRTGTKFSDGEPVDADAVVKSLEYLKKGTRSNEAYLNVASFQKVDDDTVAINLTKRDDTILYLMGLGRSYVMAPKAIDAGTLGKDPIGSGPYTLAKSSIAGSEYHFDKVKSYWDAKAYPWKDLAIFPITDATARHNAMLSGQINVEYGDVTNLDQAKQQGWNISQRVSGWVGLVITDHTGAKDAAYGNVKFRQALNYAFDAAGVLKSVGSGAGVVTNQVFPDGGDINDPALNDRYKFNMDKAKSLMAEAGYGSGLSIHMPMSPVFQAWQPSVEQTFGQLGIKITWDNMQMPDYQISAPKYPMFISMLAMDGNDVATVNRQVATPQWFNPTPDWQQVPEVKPLVEKVFTTEGADQTAAIKALNEKLVDVAWWVPWYQAKNTYYSVKGIKIQPIIGMMFPTLRYFTQG